MASLLIPEHARVAKVSHMKIEYRVSFISSPGLSVIPAVGEILCLPCLLRVAAMTGVNRDQALLLRAAQAAGVLAVDDDAAREHHFAVLLRDCDWKLIPMQQIRTDGVSPAHVTPLIAEGIELKEEVVFPVKVDEAVGIVRPVLARREMYLRTIGLVVILVLAPVVANDLSPGNGREERQCARE